MLLRYMLYIHQVKRMRFFILVPSDPGPVNPEVFKIFRPGPAAFKIFPFWSQIFRRTGGTSLSVLIPSFFILGVTVRNTDVS